jgi:hypothetical protein
MESKARQIVDLMGKLITSASIADAEAMVQKIMDSGLKTFEDWCDFKQLKYTGKIWQQGIFSMMLISEKQFNSYTEMNRDLFGNIIPKKLISEWLEFKGLEFKDGFYVDCQNTEKEFDKWVASIPENFKPIKPPLVTEDEISYQVHMPDGDYIYAKNTSKVLMALCKEILK